MSIETTTDVEQEFVGSRGEARGLGRPGAPAPGIDGEFPLDWSSTTLAELCPAAIEEVGASEDGAIEYTPDQGREGSGEWDARRVAYAVTILLEDAVKRSGGAGPVSLRWREYEDEVVLRVQFPRPLERGDRFVTYFEEGVRPDGADDKVGTLRLVVARKIVLQHGGHLARVRTRAGTAYVATLPRTRAAAGRAEPGLELE
ncbi:HAMP domain-containing histidine kinase [Anaeromyxobacter sp. Fw109-5]|uniref:HAMP domain-containing histidine kinase n=1 Tax=Anaeromyxobacter sp. (strain Fw109-5) TaxID=404589 RepID=UPI000315AC02|nr:HAMP domain-containing histidine kinase [Anaeromyxobacter sp. Fw109-5]